jgi:hypothetical protein
VADLGYRGIHEATDKARAIIQAFYGELQMIPARRPSRANASAVHCCIELDGGTEEMTMNPIAGGKMRSESFLRSGSLGRPVGFP